MAPTERSPKHMFSDFTAVFVVVLFAIIAFVSAMKNGVARLLASGCAAAVALALLFAGMNWLPKIAGDAAGPELSPKAAVGISIGVAVLVYFVSLMVFLFVFKWMLGPDGWFHWAVDGIPGGLLSLLPSVVVAVFLFTCVRVAGTVQELNYTATLSQDNIEDLTRRIPPYPFSANWRNGIEELPLAAPILDGLDPFSNRLNRNAAALVMMQGSGEFRRFLLTVPETAELAAEDAFLALRQDVDVRRALGKQDRLGLVLDPTLRETARNLALANELRTLSLKPILLGFGRTLQPDEPNLQPLEVPES